MNNSTLKNHDVITAADAAFCFIAHIELDRDLIIFYLQDNISRLTR